MSDEQAQTTTATADHGDWRHDHWHEPSSWRWALRWLPRWRTRRGDWPFDHYHHLGEPYYRIPRGDDGTFDPRVTDPRRL